MWQLLAWINLLMAGRNTFQLVQATIYPPFENGLLYDSPEM